jgi:hypothetical protein
MAMRIAELNRKANQGQEVGLESLDAGETSPGPDPHLGDLSAALSDGAVAIVPGVGQGAPSVEADFPLAEGMMALEKCILKEAIRDHIGDTIADEIRETVADARCVSGRTI